MILLWLGSGQWRAEAAFGDSSTSLYAVSDPPQTPLGSFICVLHSRMFVACEVKEGGQAGNGELFLSDDGVAGSDDSMEN